MLVCILKFLLALNEPHHVPQLGDFGFLESASSHFARTVAAGRGTAWQLFSALLQNDALFRAISSLPKADGQDHEPEASFHSYCRAINHQRSTINSLFAPNSC